MTCRRWLLGSILIAASGCYSGEQPKCSIACNADEDCPGGLACSPQGRCGDVDETCEITCDPRTYLRCDGTKAQVCNAAGNGAEEYACGAAGCVADETGPHCVHVVPEYAESVCDQPASLVDYVPPTGGPLDTNDSGSCSTVIEQGDVDLCVIHAGAITLSDAATVSVIGHRALAFVADREIVMYTPASITANALPGIPGPGADLVPSGDGPTSITGGDGAGNATAGGGGGGKNFAPGGALVDSVPRASAFIGGRSARSSVVDSGGSIRGGGGGGAIMLVSCLGKVQILGMIDVGGGGGGGGFSLGSTKYNGGGGGAGGHVLIQAMSIELDTRGIYANGGGGGGGMDPVAANVPGMGGESGSRYITGGGPGGASGGNNTDRGGEGGFGDMAGQHGSPTTPGAEDGRYTGGGGGVGIIEMAVPGGNPSAITGTPATADGAGISPGRKLLVVKTR